jgi:hypothetical protein
MEKFDEEKMAKEIEKLVLKKFENHIDKKGFDFTVGLMAILFKESLLLRNRHQALVELLIQKGIITRIEMWEKEDQITLKDRLITLKRILRVE